MHPVPIPTGARPISTLLEELRQIVARGECDQVEFKKSTGQRTDAAKTVCGMLNASGGFVLFGVADDGAVIGQQVTTDTLEGVVRELRRIEPHAFLAPETIELGDGRAVILVRVPRGGGPYSYDGRPYVRLGPTTSVMSPAEYERLVVERMQPLHRWEIQPAAGLGVADLDHAEIVRTAEEAIRTGRIPETGTRRAEDLLLGFGLLDGGGRPLNAAVVLFGRRERLLPVYTQCQLRLARFRGRDSTEFVDNRQELGNVFELFQRAQLFLRDHLPVAGRIVPELYERVDDPLYPPVALREAVVNALCHRDYGAVGGSVGIAIYDDRLEISSTGPLRFGLTPENLVTLQTSRPWNPTMATVLYLRGLIERWGRGIRKIRELTERAGLVAPEFVERAGEVVVRFFPGTYVPPTRVAYDLTELQRSLLSALAEGGPASSVRLQEQVASSYSNFTILENLRHLRQLRLVEKTGSTRGARWRLVDGRVP
ncbi:MAG TPA: ATP-binding protein [Longimicrobium sp.]